MVIISVVALSFLVTYLINPLMGLAYFTAVRNVFAYIYYAGDTFHLSADGVAILLIIIVGIFSFVRGRNFKSVSFLAFLLFIIVGAASFFVAHDHINFFKKLFRLIGYLFLYILVQEISIDKRSIRILSVAIILSIFITIFPALYYFKTHFVAGVVREGPFQKMGLLSKNNFGFYAAYMTLFLFYPLSYKLYTLVRPIAIILLPIVISALFLSYTRAAWVGFFAGLLIFGLLSDMKRRIVIPFFIVAMVIAAFSSMLYKGLYIDPTQSREYGMSSWEYRTKLAWPSSIKCIKERPIFGYGLGNDSYAMKKIAHFDNTSHNDYLLVTVEMGLIGLFCYVFLLGSMYVRTYRAFRTAEDREIRFFCLVTLAIFTTYIIGSAAEHLLQTPGATGYVITMLGMAHASLNLTKRKQALSIK